MTTEQYSMGYEEGYRDGLNAAVEPSQPLTNKQTMKLALGALEHAIPHKKRIGDDDYLEGAWQFHNKAIAALKAALMEQPSQQEPAQLTKWAHLPNAAHIDRVLTHLKSHQDKWDAVWVAAVDAAVDAARDAARVAVADAVWVAAVDAVWVAAVDAAGGAIWEAAWNAAWEACMALIAWDDCAYILDMPPYAVKLLAIDNNPAAVLLYPAVIAMQGESNE